MDEQVVRDRINELLADKTEGKYERIKELLEADRRMVSREKDLAIASVMLSVCEQEKEEGQRILFDKVASLQELVERYTRLMFYLRRFDYDLAESHLKEFYRFVEVSQVSSQELFIVLYCGVIHKDKVLQIIKDKMVTGDLKL